MVCLDTNVVIGVINQRSASLVTKFEQEAVAGDLALSAVVLFELEYGISKSERRAKTASRLAAFLTYSVEILPFETPDAREPGDIVDHAPR